MNQEKIDSPLLKKDPCVPRCCYHWGVGRRACCKCGRTRVEQAPASPAPYPGHAYDPDCGCATCEGQYS